MNLKNKQPEGQELNLRHRYVFLTHVLWNELYGACISVFQLAQLRKFTLKYMFSEF